MHAPPAAPPDQRMSVRGFDRLLTTQRPVVLAHIRHLRRRYPEATPQQIVRHLELRFLAAVTVGGAGVGASAAIPGAGTGVALALTAVETGGFLEASALFAQSVTEVHGIAVTDPDRARTIVMAMMLGSSGADLVRNLAAQATGGGVPQTKFWGDVIGKSVPQAVMGPIADTVKATFMKRFTRGATTGTVGRLIPFGIGAVIGGMGNNTLGKKIVANSRLAFGPAPLNFPDNLSATAPERRRLPSPRALMPSVLTRRKGRDDEHPAG